LSKLARKVNAGLNSDSPGYIRLHYKYSSFRHKTEFDHMCELKKHMHLHEDRRVEIHIVELTLAEAYRTPEDLIMIDTLLKINIENLEQVSKIRAIIPANKCLGLKDQYHKSRKEFRHGWSWLVVVDPKCLGNELPESPGLKYFEDPVINSIMNKINEENKTVYMIIHTHEGSLENPVEYFEELPLFPEWVKQIKLIFTWTVKDILMEENKSTQESLITGKFIQSKRYPNYRMKLLTSEICDCDSGSHLNSHTHAISESHIIPVNGCPLPMKKSLLKATTSAGESSLELWEKMFKFAWRKHQSLEDTDTTTFSSESDSDDSSDSSENSNTPMQNETDLSEDSDDVWPDTE
jgi:hypothetical protein